ncbi:MAG: type II toxin-antitoxin system VapC family toxin [Acidobacteria bacterium]|nr:type II toxin-antitoxin system VapC family toxin [Acidobacteriota bacterium]
MPPKFIDTSYVYALINPSDQWHMKAVDWQTRLSAKDAPLLTTEFVLAEIADGLSSPRFRVAATKIIHTLKENPGVEIVPATSALFSAGLELFGSRSDKDWGLTDCTSFEAMTARGLTAALTTDDHFRQAGFRALLLD